MGGTNPTSPRKTLTTAKRADLTGWSEDRRKSLHVQSAESFFIADPLMLTMKPKMNHNGADVPTSGGLDLGDGTGRGGGGHREGSETA